MDASDKCLNAKFEVASQHVFFCAHVAGGEGGEDSSADCQQQQTARTTADGTDGECVYCQCSQSVSVRVSY
jgi:hypothetical protein